MRSYLGRTDLSRGLRNNNPGNLVKTSIPWIGKIVPGSDSRFEQFDTLHNGLRALTLDLVNDYRRDGQNTISKLINEFAPGTENDTLAYIVKVENDTGFSRNEIFPDIPSSWHRLIRSIIEVENGYYADMVTGADIVLAVGDALGSASSGSEVPPGKAAGTAPPKSVAQSSLGKILPWVGLLALAT